MNRGKQLRNTVYNIRGGTKSPHWAPNISCSSRSDTADSEQFNGLVFLKHWKLSVLTSADHCRKRGGGGYYPHWQQQPLYERKCNCRQALSLSRNSSPPYCRTSCGCAKGFHSHYIAWAQQYIQCLHSELLRLKGYSKKKKIMMINGANKICVYCPVLTGSPVLSSTRRGGGGGWFLSLRTSIPPRLSSYQAVTCTVSTVVK